MQEGSTMLAQPARFINAEPHFAPSVGLPVVVLSFGAEEGPVEDRAIQVDEARQMVIDVLASLADLGDGLAHDINQHYFASPSDESHDEDGNSEFTENQP
jgi:hypothetical protein